MNEYEIQFVDGRNADIRVTPPGGQRGPTRIVAHPVGPTPGGYPPVGYGQPWGQQPQFWGPPGSPWGGGVFSKLNPALVIDMVAQIFAALMPLPSAPVATADATNDVGNLILYQSAIAQYAKRDEQVRTLGNLIVKLLG